MAELFRDHSMIDVLDRVLDKGIVIDGWWKVSIAGISLLALDGRIVVASIETYLRYASVLAKTDSFPWTDLHITERPPGVTTPTPETTKRRVPHR